MKTAVCRYEWGTWVSVALPQGEEGKAEIQELQKGMEEGEWNKKEILWLSQMESWSGETNRWGKIALKTVKTKQGSKKIKEI